MNDENELLHHIAESDVPLDESGQPITSEATWHSFWTHQLVVATRRSRRMLLDQSHSKMDDSELAAATRTSLAQTVESALDDGTHQPVAEGPPVATLTWDSKSSDSDAGWVPPDSGHSIGVLDSDDPTFRTTRLSNETDTATRHSLFVRLENPGDDAARQLFREVFFPLVEGFARRYDCTGAAVEVLFRRFSAVVSIAIKRLAPRDSFRDALLEIVRREIADLLDNGRELVASPESREQERVEWRRDYKRCLLAWVRTQLPESISAKSWGVFWQIEVDRLSPEQVAQAEDCESSKVLAAFGQVKQEVKRCLTRITGDEQPHRELVMKDTSSLGSPLSAAGGQLARQTASRKIEDLFAPVTEPIVIGDAKILPLGSIDEYYIIERVGQGGMGVVYKAFNRALHEYRALKFIHPRLLGDDTVDAQFILEPRRTAAVRHESIVRIHGVRCAIGNGNTLPFDADNQQGWPFIEMEYVLGQSLQSQLKSKEPMTFDRILTITNQVAEALTAAHAKGIVHRDIKPANLLLESESGFVKLVDFGLGIGGTVAYMSPEQTRGEPLDERSDLFSLGGTIHQMLTGELPFQAATKVELMEKIREQQYAPPERVPVEMQQLLVKLFAKDKEQRYRSAAEVANVTARLLKRLTPSEVPIAVTLKADSNPWRVWSSLTRSQKTKVLVEVATCDRSHLPACQLRFATKLPVHVSLVGGEPAVFAADGDANRGAVNAGDTPASQVDTEWFSPGVRRESYTVVIPRWSPPSHREVVFTATGRGVNCIQNAKLEIQIRPPKSLLLLVAAFVCWAIYSLLPVNPAGQFTSLNQEGNFIRVSGTARNIPQDHKLILAAETSEGYWPKDTELVLESDGSWHATIEHSAQYGTGEIMLSLWSAPPTALDRIAIWLKNGKLNNHFPPMDRIEDGTKLDSTRVTVGNIESQGAIESQRQEGEELHLAGTVTNTPNSAHLYLVVQTKDSHWPKDTQISRTNDGRWSAVVKHAPSSADAETNIAIWSVSAEGHAVIQRWLNEGKSTDHYPPMDRIPGGKELHCVTLGAVADD